MNINLSTTRLKPEQVLQFVFNGDVSTAEHAAEVFARTHARRSWPQWVLWFVPSLPGDWHRQANNAVTRGYSH